MTHVTLVFVETSRITTEQPDLGPVFGSLTSAEKDSLIDSLRQTEDSLFAWRDSLATEDEHWACEGVTLETFPSGRAQITGYVENPSGLAFAVQLMPENCLDGPAWKPGQPPKVMSYEDWDVTGEVLATPDRYGSTVVAEMPSRHANSPESACSALLDLCRKLRDLASRHPPTNEAWLDEDSDGNPVTLR